MPILFLGALLFVALVVLAVVAGSVFLVLRASADSTRRRRVVPLGIAGVLAVLLLGLALTAGLSWHRCSVRLADVRVSVGGAPAPALVWQEALALPAEFLLFESGQPEALPNAEHLAKAHISLELEDGNGEIAQEVEFRPVVRQHRRADGSLAYISVGMGSGHMGRLHWRCEPDVRFDAVDSILALDLYVGPPEGPFEMTTLRFLVTAEQLTLLE